MNEGLDWLAWAVASAASVGVLLMAAVTTKWHQRCRTMLRNVALVAEGDLTAVNLPDRTPREDAAAIARLVDNWREVLTRLQTAHEALDGARLEVDDVALQMLTTTEQTADRGTRVAASAEDVATNMQSIAAACEEMSATIREISSHAATASTVASTASRRAVGASDQVRHLQEAARNVERVSEFITRIAKQTHLLALNATIEAAHAGGNGAGFAVVANEVKQLATQTSDSTATIETTIRDIQSGADQAGEAMGAVTEIINTVTDNQNAIAGAVEEQTAATNNIGQSAALAADSSTALAVNISGLLHSIRSAAYAGARGQVVAGDLADVGRDVAAILDRYRFDPVQLPVPPAIDLAEQGTSLANGIKTVQHYVTGTGPDRWTYGEHWRHATKELSIDGRHDSYCSMPDDSAVFTFRGTSVRLYGFTAASHGIGAVSLNGEPEETFDLYGETRERRLIFASRELPFGTHTVSVRVTGEKNPASRYIWLTIEKAEIVGSQQG